jgi:hypothetical protein
MADEQPTREFDPTAETERTAPSGSPAGQSPLSVGSEEDPFAERPEAYVGAAFAGGLALALIVRRLAR